MRITFFLRKPYPYQFSIEKIFKGLRKKLTENGSGVVEIEMPYYSTGILSRVQSIMLSSANQGDINHITGDIHFIALGLEKSKTILTIHDLNFLNGSNFLTRFILKTFWLTLPLKRVAYLTVISEATKADLLSRIDFAESRIKVIPNYYDPAFKAFPKVFNKAQPRILQIGTKDNKNVLRLIEALDGISCHLIIVGADSFRIMQWLLRFNISYTWLQNLTNIDLVKQYQECDILSFPSIIEGFGMPILEAQATGRVVVTSNVSSMPEVAGNGACYVDPLSVESIRAGFLKVIADDGFREALILNGYDNIKRFEISHVAAMYRELYEEVYQQSISKF